MRIEAVYEHGVLRPVTPLNLPEGKHIELSFVLPALDAQLAYERAERDAWELATINVNADRLNEEALDVLDYQIAL